MSNSAVVHVGTPSPEFQRQATAKVCYHGFADLSTERDSGVISPEFACLGHLWRLEIFPGGVVDARSGDGMVGLCLYNESDEEIKINFGFCVKDSNGSEVANTLFPPTTFGAKEGREYANFTKHSTTMESLAAGALIVDVRMKPAETSKTPTAAFIPENQFANTMLKSFMDDKTADVVFEVRESNRNSDARKKAKTTPATLYAHLLILKNCAAQLAEFCGLGGKDTPVLITDVDPDVFYYLLFYVYGGKVADNDLKENAKAIIDAANRYGISNLKLEAEACFLNSTTIGVGNMMEILLYADAMNCALLKEAVMDFIVENKVEVLEKVLLKDIPGGMFADILAAVARGEKKNGYDEGRKEDQFSIMRICDLRRKVHERGLDVDGSREMLIATLKENS